MGVNMERQTLAYLGPEASFTHQLALELQATHPLYKGVLLKPAPNIAAVCQMVAEGIVNGGVVPVENSTDNRPVNETIAALERFSLHIRVERTTPISQSAYYLRDVDPMDIKWLITKDSAYGQVKRTVAQFFPNAIFDPRDSTAAAILEAAEDPEKVAVGPKMTGDYYNLSDIFTRIDDIHDNPLNATRFIVVDADDNDTPITGRDKTSLIARMPDKPGSLYRVLDTFTEQGISLTKIKSFGRDIDEIAFLMDLEGHQQDLPLANALNALLKQGVGIKRLGSYPRDTYQPPQIPWELDMNFLIEQLKSEVANGVDPQTRTVVAFTLIDEVGALRNALKPFYKPPSRVINLTEIDSLPTGRLGEYAFYLSFENKAGQRMLALNELKAHCTRMRLIT